MKMTDNLSMVLVIITAIFLIVFTMLSLVYFQYSIQNNSDTHYYFDNEIKIKCNIEIDDDVNIKINFYTNNTYNITISHHYKFFKQFSNMNNISYSINNIENNNDYYKIYIKLENCNTSIIESYYFQIGNMDKN